MLTPQEVATHAFAKAVLNGYNMAMVDEFLEQVTDDYTALYKENAALKAKMKVMVEKVEEYRATEDSMRATLLTAQRMADTIVQEAEGQRDEILAQAASDAGKQAAERRRELSELEERIRSGRQELARFVAAGRELCTRELEFLEKLPNLEVELPEEAPSSSAPAEVEAIEEKVMESFAQGAEPELAEPAAPTEPELPAELDLPEDLRDTRRVNLEDLRFGRNLAGRDR